MEFFYFLFGASLVVLAIGCFDVFALGTMIGAGFIFLGTSVLIGALMISNHIQKK